MTSGLLIGEIAKQFGLSTQAIRYYEKLSLIESPPRSVKGYRLYNLATIERLRLIQYAQKFGLSLNQIKELLAVGINDSTVVLTAIVNDRLKKLEQQLKQIETATAELDRRQQQLHKFIAEDNARHFETSDRYLLNLFQQVEGSLSVNNQTANKAQRLLELYNAGERNFQHIELTGAELNGVYLCDADFSHAEMMLASLNEAAMANAKLNRAYLSGVDFIDAYLHQAELIYANLVGANLSGADLTGANLTSSNLGGADLSGANLQNANLTEAILIGANLQNANLENAITIGCNFQEANIAGTILENGDRN